ncbi:MAG: hypothetical protein AB7P04_10780 [Bacteriovoracia bacterium]
MRNGRYRSARRWTSLGLVAVVGGGGTIGSARADSFGEKCGDIPGCARAVGELLKQKYIFDADVRGGMKSSGNVELTAENAEVLFTSMLNANGYTRVPVGDGKTYQIQRQRDARDTAIPFVTASREQAPVLPANWDMMTLKYRASHPEVIEQIARVCRSFMPAGARIIPSDLGGGMLLVTDTAMNLRKVYEIIRDHDQKPGPEQKRRWAERERKAAERERREEREGWRGPPGRHEAKPEKSEPKSETG